jgi:tRNA(Ile)-lysidine synthase
MLLPLVLQTVREYHLLDPGDRVVVALSGGADSVALLWLLKALESTGDLEAKIAGIVHVNHQLRDEESARDEEFCRALAQRTGVRIEAFAVDARSASVTTKKSIEAAARELRYGCFDEAAKRMGANRVATAHTLDDQAETVLLRLMRGAGLRGISGIRVRRGLFIRPLLGCRRADLRRYLAARGESFCEDSSNLNLAVPRNQVRHALLPVIDQIAPSAVRALARFAEIAAADEQYLMRAAEAAAASVVLTTSGGNTSGESVVQLRVGPLNALPLAIRRRVVRSAAERVLGDGTLTAASIERVLRVARLPAGRGRIDLPQLAVERCDDVVLLRRGVRTQAGSASPFECSLPVPGTVTLPAGFEVTATFESAMAWSALPEYSGVRAALQASMLNFPLTVRNRRPGDRFRPFGAPGTRKLKDVLIDRRLPRSERDALPIVIDASGRIVWVAGVTIAEHCRVTTPDTGVVVLKLGRSRVEPGA